MVQSLGFEDSGRELGKQVITCEGRHTYVYIYIYIYIYTHTYTCIYIYICMYSGIGKKGNFYIMWGLRLRTPTRTLKTSLQTPDILHCGGGGVSILSGLGRFFLRGED